MKRFTQLFCELDETNRTNDKVAALEKYFRDAPREDAAWALRFLTGRLLQRCVTARQLRDWTAAESGLPAWLVDECYDAVGDFGETMALLFPDSGLGTVIPLARLVHERLLPLPQLPEGARRDLLVRTWRDLNSAQRFVWNKLITGSFRIGVARTLVIRALAGAAGVEQAVMAHRVMGSWEPTGAGFLQLIEGANEAEIARPYPFFLASPIETKLSPGQHPGEVLGEIGEWQAEWKWDGIRAQLIRRGGAVMIWSRGDDMVTDAFPEIAEAAQSLPDGTVLDGELLAWRGDAPLPFGQLQRRLGRKKVAPKVRAEFPIAFLGYDLLEIDRRDLRSEPLRERRAKLERVLAETAASGLLRPAPSPPDRPDETPLLALFERPEPAPASGFPLRLSPVLEGKSWDALAILQADARARGVEGVMLKRLDSGYGVGRQRGDWWKWKINPLVIDAVLIYAQRGHGRRASLYTDYTFGLWEGGELVPVAKAYSGLSDDEIKEVDHFVRHNTIEQFGPVRVVKPELVFELAFEGIQQSTRHRAGLAVRFPRMNRWRRDKKPPDADSLDALRALIPVSGAPASISPKANATSMVDLESDAEANS